MGIMQNVVILLWSCVENSYTQGQVLSLRAAYLSASLS